MTILTPTLRTSVRKSLFWIVTAIALLVLAFTVVVITGASEPEGTPLSATNAGPAGSKAVVEVLRQQGVEVVVAATSDEALDALGDGSRSTLMLHDADQFLAGELLSKVGQLAQTTVLVDPGFAALRELAPAVGAAGVVDGTLPADCDNLTAVRSETVGGEGSGFRLVDESLTAELCFPSGDDVYSLIRIDSGDRELLVLGAVAALTNERVAEHGNAALALGLLGQHGTLVWYQPTAADVEGAMPTIAELTPAWVSAVLALLLIVAVAAGVSRGRRLGPLVVENLPVIVPSSETMEGRARLYQKSSARLRALDSLRIGAIARLASACGLPRTASVDDVIAAVAGLTGIDAAHLRADLLDAVPAGDRDLIRMSDALLTLERTVAQATRPRPGKQPPKHQGE